TVVMCSHLLADVQDVCDRIAILYGGELKELGRVEDLLKEQHETQLVTSKLDEATVDEIKAVLDKHGASLKSCGHPTSSLEDLFMKTVQRSKDRPGQRYVPAVEPGTADSDS
ncbi:MAG: ABC transporter ATP-binding protein, partial [Rhodopirellula sp.]|nr:ABC transporter ATP-binding protein [Rhodopirellula sp.]